jgi:hypothetical protein
MNHKPHSPFRAEQAQTALQHLGLCFHSMSAGLDSGEFLSAFYFRLILSLITNITLLGHSRVLPRAESPPGSLKRCPITAPVLSPALLSVSSPFPPCRFEPPTWTRYSLLSGLRTTSTGGSLVCMHLEKKEHRMSKRKLSIPRPALPRLAVQQQTPLRSNHHSLVSTVLVTVACDDSCSIGPSPILVPCALRCCWLWCRP